jgi:hypothetical protein
VKKNLAVCWKTRVDLGDTRLPERLREQASSENSPSDADNQQGSPLLAGTSTRLYDPSETTRQRLCVSSFREYQAYLQGALHDGTRSILHHTHRISQKGTDWLQRLSFMFTELGHRSWIYQEGKTRQVFALETSAPFLDVFYDPDQLVMDAERIAYVRGYFDAEGGIPFTPHVRFYVQFTQKNEIELGKVKAILESLDVKCGKLHNPSYRVDPDYWRFYVRAKSYRDFACTIGSCWHPRKEMILQRMMI